MPFHAISRACLIGAVLAWATRATVIGAGAAELTFDLHIERGRVAENMSVIRVARRCRQAEMEHGSINHPASAWL